MGQELIARSSRPAESLWSTAVLAHEPEIVRTVHAEFARAGSTALTIAAYTATPERLARSGWADRFDELQAAAVQLALRARDEADHAVDLLGCLPPLAASYHPEMAPPRAGMLDHYRRIVAAQAPHVDVMLAETMSSVREIEAAVEAMREGGVPFWVAMSVDDADGTRLRSGEPLDDGVRAARDGGASALLLNCSRPEAIARGLPALAADLPFGAYANGFTNAAELRPGGTVEGMSVRTDLDPESYAGHAMEWVGMGATIVGGCCQVGPAHIRALHDRLRQAGHEIVPPREATSPR